MFKPISTSTTSLFDDKNKKLVIDPHEDEDIFSSLGFEDLRYDSHDHSQKIIPSLEKSESQDDPEDEFITTHVGEEILKMHNDNPERTSSLTVPNKGEKLQYKSASDDKQLEPTRTSCVTRSVGDKIESGLQYDSDDEIGVSKSSQVEKIGHMNTDKLTKKLQCSICMVNIKNTIILSCGHTICSECIPKLKLCPICDGTIGKTQNIYLKKYLKYKNKYNKLK